MVQHLAPLYFLAVALIVSFLGLFHFILWHLKDDKHGSCFLPILKSFNRFLSPYFDLRLKFNELPHCLVAPVVFWSKNVSWIVGHKLIILIKLSVWIFFLLSSSVYATLTWIKRVNILKSPSFQMTLVESFTGIQFIEPVMLRVASRGRGTPRFSRHSDSSIPPLVVLYAHARTGDGGPGVSASRVCVYQTSSSASGQQGAMCNKHCSLIVTRYFPTHTHALTHGPLTGGRERAPIILKGVVSGADGAFRCCGESTRPAGDQNVSRGKWQLSPTNIDHPPFTAHELI